MRALLAWAIGLTLFVMLPALWFPPCRDTALFLLVGDTINNGGMPYRDAWELKPPAVYLAYALPAWLGGNLTNGWILVRVMDTLLTIAATYLIFRLARRLAAEPTAIAAGGWYLVLYFCGGYQALAQAEAWSNVAAIGALTLLWRWREYRGNGPAHWGWTGLLTGIVVAFKPTSILPIGFSGLTALVERGNKGKSSDVAHIAFSTLTLVAGVILPPALMALWLWKYDALPDYLSIQQNFVAPYVKEAKASFFGTLEFFVVNVIQHFTWAILPGVLCIFGLVNRTVWHPGAKSFTVASLAGGFLAVWLQSRGFTYHYQVMLPALAIAAGVGTTAFLEALPDRLPRLTIAVALVLGWQVFSQAGVYFGALRYVTGNWTQSDWRQYLAPATSRPELAEADQAIAYVRNNSNPQDRFLIFGFENDQNVLANRRAGTNYFLNPGLVTRFADPEWREEFIDQMNAAPPEYLEILRDDDMAWIGAKTPPGAPNANSYHLMMAWPELRQIVESRYRLVLSKKHLNLYELKEAKGDSDS